MLDSPPASPPAKKAKLTEEEPVDTPEDPEDDSENHCSICLQAMEDRTVIPHCSHEFCFDCLMIWTAQSRRCPLCAQIIGDYLIHDIRSRYDYRKHYLTPLRSNSPPLLPLQTTAALEARNAARRRRRDREHRRRHEELDELDKLEFSIAFRRWIYKHDLYAKHVASNSFTKYRPYPTPAQFTASPDLISRTTTFLRRELQIWQGLDVEFLTNLIISLIKAIDIRSESAVKLLAEFLDMDTPFDSRNRRVNAEHFAHEVYSYVRSPFRDLFIYDSVVQYERPRDVSPPPQTRRQNVRWQAESPESHEHNPQMSYSLAPSSRQLDHRGSSLREQGRVANSHQSNRSTSPNIGLVRHKEWQKRMDESTLRTPTLRITGQSNSEDKGDINEYTSASGKGKERQNSVVIDHSGLSLSYPDSNGNGRVNDISVPAELSAFGISNRLESKQKVLNGHVSSLSDAREGACASSTIDPPEVEKDARTKRTRPRSLVESIRTHLKPAAATSRLLKKERDILSLRPDSKGSHDPSTPPRICPSDSISSAFPDQDGLLDRTDKHRFEGKLHGDFALGRVSIINPSNSSDSYFIKGEAAPGNGVSHPSTSGGLHSACGDIAPLAQQQPSLPIDSLQGESELVQDVPQNTTTSTAGAQQVDLLETEMPVEARALERDDKDHVKDNRARQIDNPHVAPSLHPAPPMTVAKQNSGPFNPDLIMTHQGDGYLLLPKQQPRLNDNEKSIREAIYSHQPREGVKEVKKRQYSPHAEATVTTSASEGSLSRVGVGRSMLDCRGIDGDKMEDKDVLLNPRLDTTALEASLKKRMRLRAKLAAEKQAAESR